jgi:hypothetical protein
MSYSDFKEQKGYMLSYLMSYSDFKEQKGFNFPPACFSGFSVEAAENVSNPLMQSTAFLKKSFSRTSAGFDVRRTAVHLFQARRAIV